MKAPRIDTLPVAQAERLAAELGLPAATGRLLAFRAIAAHAGLARGIFTQHSVLRHEGLLADRLRELLILRIAWRAGSAYEWTQHWNIAIACGLSPDELARVRDAVVSPAFSAAERAVLEIVDDVFDRGEVDQDRWASHVHALGDPRLVLEAVAATNHWRGLAVLFRTLRLPLEEGMQAWPPDGRAPERADIGGETRSVNG